MTRQIVAIGGGHGLAGGLAGLRLLPAELTAVVTTADDGGSSGRLRKDLGVIALGDLRMALLALASHEDLAEVLALRFPRGELSGHAVGNLMLLALVEEADGDVVSALDRGRALLGCVGRVLPATTEAVQLKATVSGMQVHGQANVTSSGGRIEQVWIEPQGPAPCPEAVDAIHGADAIVIGPGSLFTSLVAPLLIPGLLQAVLDASAPVIYLANLTQQQGETAGLDLEAHVAALLAHLGGLELAAVIAQEDRGDGVGIGTELALTERVDQVVTADLIKRHADGTPAYGHDSEQLARVLRQVLGW